MWRTRNPQFYETPKLKWLYLISGGIGIALLYYGGHLGAKLAGRILWFILFLLELKAIKFQSIF